MRFERDELRLIGGVRHGRTLGSPVAVEILNSEWPKWEQEMSAAPGTPTQKQTKPRPGHADLAGMQKYNFDDARDVLERASARETAARVVAGALAKALLSTIGVAIVSHVIRIGEAATPLNLRPLPGDLEAIDENEVRCFDPESAEAMIVEIKAAAKVGDSLGGIVEVIAYGVPVGLGSHVQWDRKLDGLLAGALMSIQAVKAVEIGDGFTQASQRGSVAHDAIAYDATFVQGGGYIRRSDHAGGTEGGISSGAPIIAKVAMKPLSTLNRPVLETVDVVTHETAISFKERTDVTAVPALGVVAEAMMALVLANEALRKFGGDSVEEFTRNHASYIANLGSTSSAARPG
jgi:chorismate synthase